MQEGNGLISAYILDGAGGGRKVGWEEVANWKAAQGALWIHLDHVAEDARQWLRETSGMDQAVARILLTRETRPRSMDFKLGFLVLLRGVNLNPGQQPEDMVSVRIWVEPNRIITLRHRKLMAVQDLRDRLESGQGPTDTGGLFSMLAGLLADRMEPVLEKLEQDISLIERGLADDRRWISRHPAARPQLGELQRDAIAIRRYLAPQHRALAAFDDGGFSFVSDLQRMSLRETEDRITRYEEDLTAHIERAAVLHDQITNELAERMNRTMYFLSLVAAIFLPLGFITDLFGTNLPGVPGAGHPFGFGILVAAEAGIAVVVVLVFRWLRWL